MSWTPNVEMTPAMASGAVYTISLAAVVAAASVADRVRDWRRTGDKAAHVAAVADGRPLAESEKTHSTTRVAVHKAGTLQAIPPLPSVLGTSMGTGEILMLSGLVLLNALLVLLPVQWPDDPEMVFDMVAVGNRAAWVGCGNAFFIFMSATRNSILTFVTGVSFERTLVFHRWFGWFIFAEMTVHAACSMVNYAQFGQLARMMATLDNTFATVSWASLVVLSIMSLPAVRRKLFRAFYYTHFLFLAFVVFGALHRVAFAWFVGMGMALYLVDRTVRFVRSRARTEVLDVRALTSEAGGCTRLIVKVGSGRPREWEAGQYAFLSLPRIGTGLDYYPMSVSSPPDVAMRSQYAHLLTGKHSPTGIYRLPDGNTPDGTVLAFHIKAAGGFTSDLYAAASNLRTAGGPAPSSPDALLESGVEAMRKLTHLHVDGFHGSSKLDFSTHPAVALVGGGIGITPLLSIARDILNRMCLPLSPEPGAPTLAFRTRAVYLMWYARTWSEYAWLRGECLKFWHQAHLLRAAGGGKAVLRVFLTREAALPADALPAERANVFPTRPTPEELLRDVKARHPRGDVAVAVCGPSMLVRDVRNGCAGASDEKGLVGVHWEHFEL